MIPPSNTPNATTPHTSEWLCTDEVAVLKDHFPHNPIIPAYLQLAHVQQVASSLCALQPDCIRVKRVKFLKALPPGEPIRVTCELDTKGTTVRFSLMLRDEVATHGELVCQGPHNRLDTRPA